VASELFFWTGSKMRVPPWNELPRSFPNANLVRQVENRIYKKQTGNLVAYQAFLDWYAILNTNLDLNSSSSNVNFVQELLAFPVEEFFWDRVFEVWVLQEIYFSLLRNGCVTETETADLNTRGASPIYDLHFNGRAVSVYFQCGFNGDSARWSYESTGKNLRGIPDVLVDDGQDGLLVVDAKNRSGDNIRSKSEEIYKMLGYIENFRSLQEEKYFGILFFVSQNYQREQVLAENGGRLLLMTATLERIPSSFETDLDEMILGWLNR
jgi:hypothetical protein